MRWELCKNAEDHFVLFKVRGDYRFAMITPVRAWAPAGQCFDRYENCVMSFDAETQSEAESICESLYDFKGLGLT